MLAQLCDGIFHHIKDNPLSLHYIRKNFTIFVRHPLMVEANENQVMPFLQLCEKAGLKWTNGKKPTAYLPTLAKKGAAFGFISTAHYAGIHYTPIKIVDEYRLHGYTIVDFKSFITRNLSDSRKEEKPS